MSGAAGSQTQTMFVMSYRTLHFGAHGGGSILAHGGIAGFLLFSYGALPTGFGEVRCPTRASRLRPRRLRYWQILLTYYGGGDITVTSPRGITKNRQVHTNTAAGKSTIIPPLWIRPSSLNWEEQQNNPHPTLSYPSLSDPNSTYST